MEHSLTPYVPEKSELSSQEKIVVIEVPTFILKAVQFAYESLNPLTECQEQG